MDLVNSQDTIDIIFLSLQNTYSGLSGINYGIMDSFTDKGIFCSQYAELAFRNTGENDLQIREIAKMQLRVQELKDQINEEKKLNLANFKKSKEDKNRVPTSQ